MTLGALTMLTGLAWRPFLDPLPLHDYWMWMILPLAVAIAVVYKTLRLDDLSRLPVETVRLTLLIIVSMIAAGALLWAIVEMV